MHTDAGCMRCYALDSLPPGSICLVGNDGRVIGLLPADQIASRYPGWLIDAAEIVVFDSLDTDKPFGEQLRVFIDGVYYTGRCFENRDMRFLRVDMLYALASLSKNGILPLFDAWEFIPCFLRG